MPKKNKSINALRKSLLFTLLAGASVAQAVVIDHPSFTVAGVVVVLGGDGAGGASVNDFIVADGNGVSVDLIASDVIPVVTGTLNSFSSRTSGMLEVSGQTLNDQGAIGTLDAGDSFASFAPVETVTASFTRLSSSFYVASNTAFSIKAVASLDTESSSENARLKDIYRRMFVSKSGTVDGGSMTFGVRHSIRTVAILQIPALLKTVKAFYTS